MSEPNIPATPRRAAVVFIFITVMLDVLALGLIIPVLPKLVIHFVGGETAHAATIFGLINTVGALMQFLCSPVVGALSDRFGRRPVVLCSNFGLGLDYILMAWRRRSDGCKSIGARSPAGCDQQFAGDHRVDRPGAVYAGFRKLHQLEARLASARRAVPPRCAVADRFAGHGFSSHATAAILRWRRCEADVIPALLRRQPIRGCVETRPFRIGWSPLRTPNVIYKYALTRCLNERNHVA